jgi:asparagine synthase (glutamine-hydrolysing)
MCGIAGFTQPGQHASLIIDKMREALGHRGPDGHGKFVDLNIALGHSRLAIIDPSGGAQPRVDEASGDALIFNGEIFGYRELAAQLQRDGTLLRDRSDTEVLFQLIRRHGVRGALERIDGQFAFAFRHGASGALYLARDRFGEKPLYYAERNRQLVFGSEAAALLVHPALSECAPDRLAAYQLLLFEYLPGDRSGWDGVFKLEPGCFLKWQDGVARLEKFWTPPFEQRVHHNETEALEQLEQLMARSVNERVIADVPLGVFLSGGIDSSLIAAFASHAAPDLTAFTVRMTDSFDETPHAISVAQHLKLRHTVVTLGDSELLGALDAISNKLSEPLGDSSLLPTFLVCRAAREAMTVALGGDGADELFAGYPNFKVQHFASVMRCIPQRLGQIVRQLAPFMPQREGYMNWSFLVSQLSHGFGAPIARQSFLWMAPFSPDALSELWSHDALPAGICEAAFAPVDTLAAQHAGEPRLQALLRMFLATYLPDDILMKSDRASMFNSLEVRAPFLDRALAEYVITLPEHLKLRGGSRKYLLKKLAARHLPSAIVARKKHGFALPVGRYIRTLFRERFQDVLLSRDNPVAPWFNRTVVEEMLRTHLSGRQDLGKKLWSLYVLFTVAGRTDRLSRAIAA